jgi:hypothetical protein
MADYLLVLRHEAHRNFPADRAEEIVAEVQGHLQERVEKEEIAGVPASIAEAEALASFGNPRQLVRYFLNVSYETLFSKRSRQIGIVLLVVFTGIVLGYRYYAARQGFTLDTLTPTLTLLLNILFGATIIRAFLGRKPQPIHFGIYAGVLALIGGLGYGFNTIDLTNLHSEMATTLKNLPPHLRQVKEISRVQLPLLRELEQLRLEAAERDIALLTAGIRAFTPSPNTQSSSIPSSLLVKGEYLVPASRTSNQWLKQLYQTRMERMVALERRWAMAQNPVDRKHLEGLLREAQLNHYGGLPSVKSGTKIPLEEANAFQEFIPRVGRVEPVPDFLRPLQRGNSKVQIEYTPERQLIQDRNNAPYITVPDYATAQTLWQEFGKLRLEGRERYAERKRALLTLYDAAETGMPTIHWARFSEGALFFGGIGLYLLVFDIVFATLGRFFWRVRREWFWRMRYTTIQ